MICLPPDLEPLALLRTYCCENLEEGARILMGDCDEMCSLDRWEYAEAIAQDAENRGADGDWNGCAIVLLKLAETCREANEFTMAHRYGERAFACCQGPAEESKMTEAVAAYSLGIINHLRGARQGTGRCYEYGRRLFKKVEEDCLRANSTEQARYCSHAARLITKLWRHSSKQRFEAHDERFPILIGFYTSSDGTIEYRIIGLETADYPSEWQAFIDGESYGLIPLPGMDLNTLILDPAEIHLATSASQTSHPHLGTQDRDYVLVHHTERLARSDPDRSSLGIFLYSGQGRMEYFPPAPLPSPPSSSPAEYPLKFERRPNGRIVFVPVEPPPARIIGGIGYPGAILRLGA